MASVYMHLSYRLSLLGLKYRHSIVLEEEYAWRTTSTAEIVTSVPMVSIEPPCVPPGCMDLNASHIIIIA